MSQAPPILRIALLGALWANLFSFPLAVLMAAIYRFPVPFAGYQSGVSTIPMVLGAAVFYWFYGGFAVLVAFGSLAGALAHALHGSNPRRARTWMLCLSAGVALAGVAFMAVLDKLIGPW